MKVIFSGGSPTIGMLRHPEMKIEVARGDTIEVTETEFEALEAIWPGFFKPLEPPAKKKAGKGKE